MSDISKELASLVEQVLTHKLINNDVRSAVRRLMDAGMQDATLIKVFEQQLDYMNLKSLEWNL